MSEATAPLATRSPQSIAVDNLLRRDLRIGDPSDPAQIAKGLLARYPDTADEMFRERAGLNYGAVDLPPPVSNDGGGSSAGQTELALAQDYLERDIRSLTNSSELKDIDVELKGWARAVRQAASDGLAAARLALDSTQNDRAMAARRVLGVYARLARYVGALSADTAPFFRHFAQSCDVMASLVLVAIGDGLAASGITRGTSLIRVAASELQSRRNAVIQAFRTITGTGLIPNGQDEYPRGLEAYRRLTLQLESSGQSDLRTLLDESSLAAELDQLVDLAVGASPAGLRELTSTSMVVMDRLTRLVNACRAFDIPVGQTAAAGTPDAPPMVYFASALQLFIDAFSITTGGRLLYVARPPILAYGLYGAAGPDRATERLIQLTVARGLVAEQVDCYAACGCDQASIGRQVVLDYLVYRLDRAIDFYAAGYQPGAMAEPEARASALAYTLDQATPVLIQPANGAAAIDGTLLAGLNTVAATLRVPADRHRRMLLDELNSQDYAEKKLETLVQSLSLRCYAPNFFSPLTGSRADFGHLEVPGRRAARPPLGPDPAGHVELTRRLGLQLARPPARLIGKEIRHDISERRPPQSLLREAGRLRAGTERDPGAARRGRGGYPPARGLDGCSGCAWRGRHGGQRETGICPQGARRNSAQDRRHCRAAGRRHGDPTPARPRRPCRHPLYRRCRT